VTTTICDRHEGPVGRPVFVDGPPVGVPAS
jgi:hypothetical protein